jgi:phosphoribosylanthranilate isomerase
MIAGVYLKICGLTTPEDAAAAVEIGADFLGFILYPKSPRYLPLERFAALRPQLPDRPKVAVMVQPTPAELAAARAAGFDRFQIHFPLAELAATLAASAAIPREQLWLAPKFGPAETLDAAAVAQAQTWLLDTYRAEGFGGTGQTGDWPKFRALREQHPEQTWILAGGLSPENVAAALAASGATWLDVNSGVEASPGRKDPARLAALRRAIEAARR